MNYKQKTNNDQSTTRLVSLLAGVLLVFLVSSTFTQAYMYTNAYGASSYVPYSQRQPVGYASSYGSGYTAYSSPYTGTVSFGPYNRATFVGTPNTYVGNRLVDSRDYPGQYSSYTGLTYDGWGRIKTYGGYANSDAVSPMYYSSLSRQFPSSYFSEGY